MRPKIQRLTLLAMLMGGLMSTGMMAPAQAAGTTQFGGDAEFGGPCTNPPRWVRRVSGAGPHRGPGGLPVHQRGDVGAEAVRGWIETGHETFVGSLNGGAEGTFTTNYRFEGKYEPGGSRSWGAASTGSLRARGPAGSREPRVGSTSRTSSVTRLCTCTAGTSGSADGGRLAQ